MIHCLNAPLSVLRRPVVIGRTSLHLIGLRPSCGVWTAVLTRVLRWSAVFRRTACVTVCRVSSVCLSVVCGVLYCGETTVVHSGQPTPKVTTTHTNSQQHAESPLHTYYSRISTRLPKILDCSFEWGLRTPNFGEWRPHGMGSGVVPFERALLSTFLLFYRPSIFHSNFSSIFTRFRDIDAFVLQHPNFPMFPGSRWIAFWLQRAKVLG